MSVHHFSELQIEILKLYSTEMSKIELLELKNILANFFAKKGISEADKVWSEKGLTKGIMEKWLNDGKRKVGF